MIEFCLPPTTTAPLPFVQLRKPPPMKAQPSPSLEFKIQLVDPPPIKLQLSWFLLSTPPTITLSSPVLFIRFLSPLPIKVQLPDVSF